MDMPLVCDLSVMTPEQREQHQQVSQSLEDRRLSIEELSNGYKLRFSGDSETYRLLMDFVCWERLCCPFFHFTIESEPAQQGVSLSLMGSPEVKAFAREELRLG
jgi:hypothetical protein